MIPEKIELIETQHGSGLNGFARYEHRNDEWGVQVDAVREKHDAVWEEAWTADCLPNETFSSFRELRDAVNKAGWSSRVYPARVLKVEPPLPGSSGACYLCRGVKGPWTWSIVARTGWRPTDIDRASSCDLDRVATEADPRAAIEARRKWVRENPFKWNPPNKDDPEEDIPF